VTGLDDSNDPSAPTAAEAVGIPSDADAQRQDGDAISPGGQIADDESFSAAGMTRWDMPVSTEAIDPAPSYVPSDSLFNNQWHLRNNGQLGGTPGIDINVTTVWNDYNGSGVHVGVFDDEVEYTHHDLNNNYDASRHVFINGIRQNPAPVGNTEYHGTAVAGVIAAENDGVGTVGVAFGASITGVEILGLTSDAAIVQSMAQQRNFDVVNHSWGFTSPFVDSQLSSNAAWSSFFASLPDAVQNGRSGLGTVIVHSAGNDRTNQFNSGLARDTNDSNFTNSRFLVAVAAIDDNGSVSNYSTPGAALLVAAPSSSDASHDGIWTTDRLATAGTNTGMDSFTADNAVPDYQGTFGGTSAASPTVAGVVALMLQANPNLGWRDVQEILPYSSRHVGSAVGAARIGYEDNAWGFNGADNWNGGGLHFSNDYGFGLVDALAAVRLAESWTQTSTSSNEASTSVFNGIAQTIPDNNPTGIKYTFNVAQNIDIERASIMLDMGAAHTWVGDLIISLTSPDGTVSTLLNRIGQVHHSGFGLDTDLGDWVFTSNAFRGELSAGTWTLGIVDAVGGFTGSVTSAALSVYGSSGTTNDTYVYTNEYASYAGTFAHSKTLSDPDGGADALNAAAVTTASIINLSAGATSIIAGQTLTISAGTVIENAYGGDGNDTITGNSAANQLSGGRGADVLDGGAGADTMIGGTGDDIYLVDNAGDVVTEKFNEGTDTVNASNSFTLGAYVENLTLTGTGSINGTGNSGNNTITGNSGSNIIDGGAGADTMIGGTGDDIYLVDNINDLVTENVNEGSADTVYAIVDYRLSANVENLILQGAGVQGYGNALVNMILGNAGANLVDGGAGSDAMFGGAGSDAYFVDDANDTVVENSGEGSDTVFATAHFGLAANVENLILQGAADLQGYGNSQANVIYGNAGNNLLNGGVGADLMVGGAGNDTYFVDDPSDSAFEIVGDGDDAVFSNAHYGLAADVETLVLQGSADLQGYGNNQTNTLYGNTGNNLLNGAGGADTMIGGTGNDTYFVDNVADMVVENASEGADAIFSTVDYTLSANVETLVQQGTDNVAATGNALANSIFGNSGDNMLDGQGGADELTGNAGNDTFVFNVGQANGDTVVDFNGNGAAAGDWLKFVGYGTGANFTNIDAMHWQVNYNGGASHDIIAFSNGAPIAASDVLFA